MHLEAAHAVEITKIGICRQERRPANTGSQKTPTQQCYRQLDASRQKYRDKQK